jgi:hypothetical protein
MTDALFAMALAPTQRAMERDRVLTLAFLHLAPDDDDCVNRLTARVSRHGFCHAELVFDGGTAFSIYHGGVAGLRARTLANPHYELVPLLVSGAEYRACFQFCANASKQGLRFDSAGMYCSVLHLGPLCCCDRTSARAGATFCSKAIVEALQFGGVREAEGLAPSAVTPSRLYDAVRGSDRRICDSVRLQRPGGLQLLAPPQSVMMQPPRR